jgi:hypothetical protein
MYWIWFSRYLGLACTSTQSSNLKWVSGGGINSPRHPKSRWLMATKKESVRWTDARFFRASVHPVPLPCHIAFEILWHNCSVAINRRSVGSSDAEDPTTKSSDHPVLKASSWRVSVLIQTKRRIDRRCPHSDRRIIRCDCLRCSSSATRLTHLEIGPSVHPTVPRVSSSVPTHLTIAPTHVIWVPSVHLTVSFSFFFFASSTWIFAST